MENYEKVTVVVPVYNVEKYIGKCIESIIKQNYKNIEIILIDDGSKDSSGKICDQYAKKDTRIKVIHKENNGVSSARNSGIDNATGKYICFVDGDDYVMNDYIEYMLELIKKEKADISICNKMFSNFDNRQTGRERIKQITAEDATEAILNYKIPIGVYSKMFKIDLIKINKIKFFEELFMGEGFNFNVLCFQHAKKIIESNRKIYYYRRDNSTSATTKFSITKCENSLYAMDLMHSKLIIKTDRILKSWRYAKWRTYSDAFDYICLGKGKKDYSEKYKEYRRYIKKEYKSAKYVEISKKDKVRALMMGLCPEVMPIAIKVRKKIHGIKMGEI